ncbi:MAG: preprotein translocase subunit SecY [Dehalococcoidia bacterium]|nr:preprotein translocase subunit SecY [Dehalococcoidia bacterium]
MRASTTRTQGPERPALLQAMIDAFVIPDLRARILFTLGMLVVFRFLAHIPVIGIDRGALSNVFQQNQLLGFLDLFSGGGLRNLSIVALGVYPYITASIVVQLMTPVVPRLQALAKEGESGRQRMNQFTHYLMVPIALAQAYGQLSLMQQLGGLSGTGFTGGFGLQTMAVVLSLAAGTTFLVWLGELITERGIGNGVSIIIFAGIVAQFPTLVGQGFLERNNLAGLLLLLVVGSLIVYLIVLFTEAQRRVPVQYGRSVFRGGRMYRQSGTTFLPLRVNSAGMIPLIFAFSIMILPATIASYLTNPTSQTVAGRIGRFFVTTFDPQGLTYWAFSFVLVVVFTFFYTLVIFSQQNLADNLQKNGGFIPGIRPGHPTADYLNRVIIRITWGGAIFLGMVAVLPYLATQVTDVRAIQLSSASLLIMVGVALDTLRQLEAQLMMRSYEGFLR